MMNRREFIKVSAVASLSSLVGGCRPMVRWDRDAYRKTAISRVAILEAKSYDASLEDIIRRGIHLFKLDLKGKRIVLKPNLVEFDPRGCNQHPSSGDRSSDRFVQKLGRPGGCGGRGARPPA